MRDGHLADVVTRAGAVCGPLPDQARWNVPYLVRAGAKIAPDELSVLSEYGTMSLNKD